MRETDDIERLFQDSFEGFEATPPASVKTAIDKEISGGNHRLWWLLVLALLLTTTVVGFLVFPNSKNHTTKNQTIAQQNAGQSTSDYSGNSTSTSNSVHSSNQKSTSSSSTEHNAYHSNTTKQDDISTKPNTEASNLGNSKANPKQKKASLKNTVTQPKAKSNNTKKASSKKKKDAKASKNQTNTKNPKTADSGNENKTNIPSNQASTNDELNKLLLEKQKKDSLEALQKKIQLAEKEKKDSLDKIADAAKIEKAKQDSIATASAKAKADSIANAQNDSANAGNKKDKAKDPNWMTSLYFGPQFDMKSATDYKSLTVDPSFRFSGEINRTLFSGYGLTTGLGYNKTTETYTISTFTVDSTYLGMDSTAIWNQNMDSIIGYNVFSVYDVDSTENFNPTVYRTSSIFIPFYITKRFEFSDTWGMLVQAGAVVSFNKITGGSTLPLEPEPVQNRTGILVTTRVHAMYTWNDWIFSAGFNGGWYAKPPLSYTDFKGTRFFFTPQFGIHYTF